ncbi:hypothetical protein [Micromonospora sp. WMMD1155]|uniref:hypothetical protein n=1 Tax=Micromonospora sp. WMMD1155 TaxID=3016094 RepID=UPI00249BF9D0|nr:hypothetical protein [Micromonospora sp. WMMD1155]WFE53326.1 hypothetical protein O7617_24730 [Micromonospora sp. WMMD1155]
MTRQPQHDPGPPGGATRTPDSGTRRRGPTLIRIAAGIALSVMAAWAVVSTGTGAAVNAPTSGGRPVDATDDELLHRASERLIARCMARHGFTYTEQPPPSSAGQDFRYVLDDVGWAREHGYGALLGRPGAWDQDANSVNLEKLSTERQRDWQRTLLGSGRELTVDLPDLGRMSAPDNGCTADARLTLYRDLAGWYRVRRIADHVGSYVAGKVTGALEYRTGLSVWASCVRQRGYAASSPRELREIVAAEAPESVGEQAREREVDAAEAEAECATSSGLSQTIDALERRYRPEIERRFARELDALRSFEREAVPRARKTLANA